MLFGFVGSVWSPSVKGQSMVDDGTRTGVVEVGLVASDDVSWVGHDVVGWKVVGWW